MIDFDEIVDLFTDEQKKELSEILFNKVKSEIESVDLSEEVKDYIQNCFEYSDVDTSDISQMMGNIMIEMMSDRLGLNSSDDVEDDEVDEDSDVVSSVE